MCAFANFIVLKVKKFNKNYGVGRVDVVWVAKVTITSKLLQGFFSFFLKIFKINKPRVVLNFYAIRWL